MGGKSGGDQDVTQRVEIPEILQPFVRNQARIGSNALSRLEDQLAGAGADDLVAGFDPLQEQAFDLAVQRAQGEGGFIPTAQQQFLATAQGVDPQSFVDPTAFDALQSTAAGDFLFGGQGFRQAVDAAVRAAQPSILSTFGAAGRGTGGLAQAAIAEQATDAFARQFGNERQRQLAASGILADLDSQERARQLSAAGALPQLALADAQILQNIGGIRQGQAQRELTAPISAQESLIAAAGGGIPLQSLLGATQTQSGLGGGGFSGAGALGGGALGLGLGSLTAAEGATGLAALGGPLGIGLGVGGLLLGGLLS